MGCDYRSEHSINPAQRLKTMVKHLHRVFRNDFKDCVVASKGLYKSDIHIVLFRSDDTTKESSIPLILNMLTHVDIGFHHDEVHVISYGTEKEILLDVVDLADHLESNVINSSLMIVSPDGSMKIRMKGPCQIDFNSNGIVEDVDPGSKAAKSGVKVGWALNFDYAMSWGGEDKEYMPYTPQNLFIMEESGKEYILYFWVSRLTLNLQAANDTKIHNLITLLGSDEKYYKKGNDGVNVGRWPLKKAAHGM